MIDARARVSELGEQLAKIARFPETARPGNLLHVFVAEPQKDAGLGELRPMDGMAKRVAQAAAKNRYRGIEVATEGPFSAPLPMLNLYGDPGKV